MSSNTIYLITGANRGIGFGLTASLLLRPNTTVIATIRSSTTPKDDLLALPASTGSTLITTTVDLCTPELSTLALHHTLTTTHHIPHINVLIANAGTGTSFHPTLTTSPSSLLEHFQTNTLGPITLFQSLYPLLAPESKFVLISSSLGSIEAMEGAAPSLAYGVSKASANYFIRKLHFEHENITSLAVHPGWVQTGNGQAFAESVGVAEPPMGVRESVEGVLGQIDGASKETTSGCFVSYDGSIIPW